MRFGLFGSAQARRSGPDTDSSQGFRDFIENNVEAEALGYYSTFLVEHHFTGFGQVSASLNLLTWLGARTTHLRLGTAVLVLPWHNPVLLAEQAATLDLLVRRQARFRDRQRLSLQRVRRVLHPDGGGRAAVRRGAGGHHQGLHLGDAVLASRQVLAIRRTSSSSRRPRRSHIRRFWMGAGSANSVSEVAGAAITCCWANTRWPRRPSNKLPNSAARSRRAAAPFNPMEVGVARAVYITEDEADKEAAIERRYQGHMRINALARRPDGETRARYILDDEKEARHESAESALFGTPDEIMRKLERLRQGGVEYVIINFGGSRRTIRRFARDIMPAFADEPQMQVLAAK